MKARNATGMATNRLRITLWTSHRQFRSRIRHHR
jgi:hypothetical protein